MQIYYTENNKEEALALGAKLGVTPIASDSYELTDNIIIFFGEKVELIVPNISPKPFSIDFTSYQKHFSNQNLKMHPLAKAIGLKNKNLTALDATAGFGKDSALISYLGHRVIAVEQNPIIFAMLKSSNPDIELINADSYEYILELTNPYPDIIYLDPMFPAKSKNNLVKKPMQILQAVLGNTICNNEELLKAAIKKAAKKVIVKRPESSGYLASLKPDLSITKSQSTRYDIYLNHS